MCPFHFLHLDPLKSFALWSAAAGGNSRHSRMEAVSQPGQGVCVHRDVPMGAGAQSAKLIVHNSGQLEQIRVVFTKVLALLHVTRCFGRKQKHPSLPTETQ